MLEVFASESTNCQGRISPAVVAYFFVYSGAGFEDRSGSVGVARIMKLSVILSLDFAVRRNQYTYHKEG